MSDNFETELATRLVRYAKIDSQSDASSPTSPSTDIQWDMVRLLEAELTEIGATDVEVTEYGAVLATIPATAEGPVIGFSAHMDTAPQYHANGVKPRVIKGYNGGDITYPDAPDLVLSPDAFPYLAQKRGHDLITASGATLLGADDKSGIAIAMTMARHFLNNPYLEHPKIRLAFTPDEEIGLGVDPRLPDAFGVDFAYTLDGGDLGEISYETFSADGAVVTVKGVSIHPGDSKDKLVSAIHLASKIIMTLPQVSMTPNTTEGRDGFIHATDMRGDAAEMTIQFILRDFELDGLAAKGDLLRQVCEAVQASEPRAVVDCDITPQYRNMRYWLEKDMTPVELALSAAKQVGLDPVSTPVRGGTDGSRLTEMGVPTPNIFTGQQNLHGPLEWISVQDMAQSLNVCLRIAQLAAKTE